MTPPDDATLQAILDRIALEAREDPDKGRVADYIPELAAIDPDQFAIAVARPGHPTLIAGDAATPFSIQSVSKVFTLAIALGLRGDRLWERVGREPSGQAFDSVILLELERGRPRNPFINAGAIVTTDAVLSGTHEPRGALAAILSFVRDAAGDEKIHINDSVAASEIATGHRNFALAHYLLSHGKPGESAPRDAGHLFPPMRHRDDLPAACQRGPLPDRLRRCAGARLAGPHPADQRADDDLRAL